MEFRIVVFRVYRLDRVRGLFEACSSCRIKGLGHLNFAV